MSNTPSQGDLLSAPAPVAPLAGGDGQASAPQSQDSQGASEERCHLDHVSRAAREFEALRVKNQDLMGFVQHSLNKIPHPALRERVEAMACVTLRNTFVTSCASAVANKTYARPQCGRTPEILWRAAQLAASTLVEQWSLAPWHCFQSRTESETQALCAEIARGPNPDVTQLLAGLRPRNLFIASAPSDDLPTYIRRCQLIIKRIAPMYLVLDADVVDARSSQTMQEIVTSLGMPGFYLSTKPKESAQEATPLKLPEITGAAGATYLRSDGATFDPNEALRTVRPTAKKAVAAPTQKQSEQIESMTSRPAPSVQRAPSAPDSQASAGASQRSRLDALRQRQAQSKAT